MIAYLKGTIQHQFERQAIINTGNVGYLVHLTAPLLSACSKGGTLELYIHSHIREEAFELYGFVAMEELTFFRQLIEISGIGPKVAMEIVSQDMSKVTAAIAAQDSVFLSRIPGIGKKTAARVILELKDKVLVQTLTGYTPAIERQVEHDVMEALLQLGYNRHHIRTHLEKVPKECRTSEEIITYLLKHA